MYLNYEREKRGEGGRERGYSILYYKQCRYIANGETD